MSQSARKLNFMISEVVAEDLEKPVPADAAYVRRAGDAGHVVSLNDLAI